MVNLREDELAKYDLQILYRINFDMYCKTLWINVAWHDHFYINQAIRTKPVLHLPYSHKT